MLGNKLDIVAVQAAAEGPNSKSLAGSSVRRFGKTVASLSREDIVKIQKLLCMKPEFTIGTWGRRTQDALGKDRAWNHDFFYHLKEMVRSYYPYPIKFPLSDKLKHLKPYSLTHQLVHFAHDGHG